MGVSASEVEVPVHVVGARMGGVMAVLVAMSVEAMGGDHPQCEQSHPNQQHPADTLAALLDDFWNLPSEHQDGRSAYEEQQRVAEREPTATSNGRRSAIACVPPPRFTDRAAIAIR